MSRIRILPEETANRIAAGEVVERPASVVKELLENSIDAGADKITVRTENGGRKLIQVSDDGCGMDNDDAMLCLEAHATSKINETYDIDRISTLGFRGEALPSIAAVSRFRLQTRPHEKVAGVELVVSGGTLRDVLDCGCAPGTDIQVRNLFFNLPARRKFLRRPATEDMHIQETVLLQALGHPNIAFELEMNGQKVLQAGRNIDTGSRIAMLLGKDTFRSMIPVDYQEAGINITGYISRPGVTRSKRREQRAFVNGRPAESSSIFYGLREAYHTLVMKGRYPPVVLYVDMPPDQVDVNVHPTKREVRFRDGRTVAQIVSAAVRRALREFAAGDSVELQPHLANRGGGLKPAESPPSTPVATEQRFPNWERNTSPVQPAVSGDTPPAQASPETAWPTDVSSENAQGQASGRWADNYATPNGPSPSAATRNELQHLEVLGVYKALYLIAEGPSGLVLIDQHAAHERILFEKLLAAAEAKDGTSQPLLIPVTVELSPSDADILENNRGEFTRLGFGLEEFGGGTYVINAIPAHFPQENVSGMMQDIIDELRHGTGRAPRADEIAVAQAACKHAVRSEDPLASDEITRLIEDLARAEMPYTCPHGRPVMINIPDSELQKRFGRRT
ncbi:MAG: DNA mismatch repair endonuclease MutL [Lentisphaeria bacterium]